MARLALLRQTEIGATMTRGPPPLCGGGGPPKAGEGAATRAVLLRTNAERCPKRQATLQTRSFAPEAALVD